jgi:LysR family transcriptional regulator, glycine cleavage system transcriptional activator
MRYLPPLSQLRAFEAAARHRSFKLAAEELAVTAAAVSHQIRQLEERLGVRLFERRTRQVVPTAAALSLFPVLREGFDAFAEAIAALAPAPGRTTVTLSVTPAFASQWLLPRLPDVRRRHPDVELRIHASDEPVDLGASADIAVRYGGEPGPELEALDLAADHFLPVASPRLRLRTSVDLADQHLIHFEWHRDSGHRPDWPGWLRRARMKHPEARGGLRFSQESHAIQAAIAGQGVALLSATLVQGELERGMLVSPFGPRLSAPTWRLLRMRRSRRPSPQEDVWRWLASAFSVMDANANE